MKDIKNVLKEARTLGAYAYNEGGKCTFVKVLDEECETLDFSVIEKLWRPLMDVVVKEGYSISVWNPAYQLMTNVPFNEYLAACNG